LPFAGGSRQANLQTMQIVIRSCISASLSRLIPAIIAFCAQPLGDEDQVTVIRHIPLPMTCTPW
jgi:hypothetical protein